MRRFLLFSFVVASVLLTTTQARAHHESWPCDFHWWKGVWHVRQLIKCQAKKWNVPGGAKKALRVARCESGLNPRARYREYAGLYQIGEWEWRHWAPGVLRNRSWEWIEPWMRELRGRFHGRANVVHAFSHIRWLEKQGHHGWDPWVCQ